MTDYQKATLGLLAALVGLQIAESGASVRKAKELGRESLAAALEVLEVGEAADTGRR